MALKLLKKKGFDSSIIADAEYLYNKLQDLENPMSKGESSREPLVPSLENPVHKEVKNELKNELEVKEEVKNKLEEVKEKIDINETKVNLETIKIKNKEDLEDLEDLEDKENKEINVI